MRISEVGAFILAYQSRAVIDFNHPRNYPTHTMNNRRPDLGGKTQRMMTIFSIGVLWKSSRFIHAASIAYLRVNNLSDEDLLKDVLVKGFSMHMLPPRLTKLEFVAFPSRTTISEL
jgi:hypothetical protein